MARTSTLDTIANNLANASTVGFRAERDVFSSVLANAGTESTSPLDSVINSYGIMSGTMVDAKQGVLQKTGNDLDMGIEGPGYFTIQTAGGQLYTRNGSFQISTTGRLVNINGDAVLGDTGQPADYVAARRSIDQRRRHDLFQWRAGGETEDRQFPQGTELSSTGDTNFIAPAGAASGGNRVQRAPGQARSFQRESGGQHDSRWKREMPQHRRLRTHATPRQQSSSCRHRQRGDLGSRQRAIGDHAVGFDQYSAWQKN